MQSKQNKTVQNNPPMFHRSPFCSLRNPAIHTSNQPAKHTTKCTFSADNHRYGGLCGGVQVSQTHISSIQSFYRNRVQYEGWLENCILCLMGINVSHTLLEMESVQNYGNIMTGSKRQASFKCTFMRWDRSFVSAALHSSPIFDPELGSRK